MPTDQLWQRFITPDERHRSMPKWVWNVTQEELNVARIREELTGFKEKDGYGGVMIVLWGNEGYMGEEYFRIYGNALDIAAEVGLKIILWDENGFPSGSAGEQIYRECPQHLAKCLDMTVEQVMGPCLYGVPLPEGIPMGAVAMSETGERQVIPVDDTASLAWDVPPGLWDIMIFTLRESAPANAMWTKRHLVDYLDRDAVQAFLDLTHEKYYARFPHHFGSTIVYSFYDEPSFWQIEGGRIWTPKFNQKFMEKHGFDPVIYYPALFRDIGPETEAARNLLFGFRAELYATVYVKTMADWCSAHGIQLTGHMDQEEIDSPVTISGDLMKVFSHQHMPGVDEIFEYGRGSRAYKIVSSSANNYDKSLVMCEVYGAMSEDMPLNVLDKEAMDLFAKGVNFMVPHGTWYENHNNIVFPPELSFRSEKYGPVLGEYNEYVRKVGSLLQHGRHVADIAVLYPIADLQAYARFGPENPYLGGVIPEHVNYMQIGELLSLTLRHDFTYLHPEVLDGKCTVEDGCLKLNNAVNHESFSIMVMPAMRVIPVASMRKIKSFVDAGGIVIAVSLLPAKSAELGCDGEVVSLIEELFGTISAEKPYTVKCHDGSGKAYFLPILDADALSEAVQDSGVGMDVTFRGIGEVQGGNLTYIHKVVDDRHVYFVANSSDTEVTGNVLLRGDMRLSKWNPHTGTQESIATRPLATATQAYTQVPFILSPVESLIWMEE